MKTDGAERRKIMIDLDVVTVAMWDKSENGDSGRKLLQRVVQGEFSMVTPQRLFDLISEWKHQPLVMKIKNFYDVYSETIISALKLEKQMGEMRVDRKVLMNELEALSIKEEDIILVIIASLFDVGCLATFNRKHLKNNEVRINNVLRKQGLKGITIALPNEI